MLPAFGLYTHIQANRRRSALLIAGLFLLFYLMSLGLALLLRAATDDGSSPFEALFLGALRDCLWLSPPVTALVALWVWCGFRFNGFILGLAAGTQPLTRRAAPRLYDLLQNLCISRGMAMPQLRIVETEASNAFASGTRPEQYTITVTRGLLDLLDERELEAVLAHELTHIRNDDVRTMTVAVLVVGVISFVGELVYRGLRESSGLLDDSSDGKGGGGRALAILVAALFIFVAWGLSLVIRFSLSRRREYLADAGAVELTKNPDAMIAALRKIAGKGELEGVPSAVMELCLDNPRSGFADLFATHPSIEDRIAALVRHAGGRDPGAVPSAA
ncbi:M48 family metallopeptidase [Microvirga thermotolerans]|uniref:M48 family metalloprotease n=1 Tax=Microvirga thermotolerans TaxID=2651334 RepID=A0A5P9JWW8_9HYPH|nr:M48 family metallopeptidase [Microvirga thermotolerans]QFU16729.1 M48 family metalloprotease [Microvirga thermotolerans]